ncbi:kinesin family member 3 [Tieghemostelium lacteum]|uniref:Kinesin family member 3 n=1 Tax=Tieghemostelium lacteum TaxID=361077 RepID=L7VTQ6_TIELA|nr:kinesin family member 3 [Tieghemostelium lacteum]KYQ89437.1 kinesin family member 3 [Tieghemostelium lacteum]|eukprot:KYQ89437.1 kinesin family member 3 [Tieghemostelium lacteum]
MSQQQSASIRVVCRFRPQNKIELAQGGCSVVNIPDNQTVQIKGAENNHTFTFDRVYSDRATQKDVYEDAAKPVIEDICSGYNGTIFVYGQTSSGKTHTMQGPSFEDAELKGVIPRMINTIFDCINKADENIEFIVKASFIEIYMERIRDLLDPVKNNLKIREEKGKGVWVDGTTEVYIYRENDILEVMRAGAANRAIGETKMNAESSRSHSIFILSIQQKNLLKGTVKTGKLYLVDLAGSEKISKTGAQGLTLDEAKMINKSLSSLGNVINALTDGKSTHIPYRDSKLTRVLQESLGGNSRTTLIINCSPSSYNENETVSTLRFGSRAKNIKNKAKINQEMSAAELKEMLAKCNQEIESLKKYIQQLETLGTSTTGMSGSAALLNTTQSDDILKTIQEKCINLEKQLFQKEEDRKEIQDQLDQLLDQIQDKDQEIESQIQSIQSLQSHNTMLTNENNILTSQLSDFKLSLEKSKYLSSEQQILIDTLNNENSSIKSELKLLNEKILVDYSNSNSNTIDNNSNNNNNNINNSNNTTSSTSSTLSSPTLLTPPSSPTLRALNSQNEPKINIAKHADEWNEKTEQLKLLQRTPSKGKTSIIFNEDELQLSSSPSSNGQSTSNNNNNNNNADQKLLLENQQLKKKYEELEQVFIKYKLDHHNYSENNISVKKQTSTTTSAQQVQQQQQPMEEGNLITDTTSSVSTASMEELPTEMILQAEQLRKLLNENQEQKSIIDQIQLDNNKLKSNINSIEEENRVRMDEELNFLREQTNQKLAEFGVLKEALLCDLENRCQKVIDLELALDEYQDRIVTLTERLKRATKSNTTTDQEVTLIQMKLDEVTAVKHKLVIENINQKNLTQKALQNLNLSKDHISSLEAANKEAQDRYYKLAVTTEALTLENNRLKSLISDFQQKKHISPSLNEDQVITGARIVKPLRGGGGIQGKTLLSQNLYSNTKSSSNNNNNNTGSLSVPRQQQQQQQQPQKQDALSPLTLTSQAHSITGSQLPTSITNSTSTSKENLKDSSSFFGLFKKKSSANLLSPSPKSTMELSVENSNGTTTTSPTHQSTSPVLPVASNIYIAAVPTSPVNTSTTTTSSDK